MLYVVGGSLDPNIAHLMAALRRLRRTFVPILIGPNEQPTFHWDLESDVLLINGEAVRPTSVFLRYDVFANLSDQRPESAYRAHCWYVSVEGWLQAHPDVAVLNRNYSGTTNKIATLCLARDLGIAVPRTVLSNDFVELEGSGIISGHVVKPVIGGEYTRRMSDVLPSAERRGRGGAAPAIVQEELVSPDFRVYQIGSTQTAFRIQSQAIDYRTDSACKIEHVEHIESELALSLRRLTRVLRLDFSAADYKVNARTGELEFLEINSAPMFVAFDRAARFTLTRQIFKHLQAICKSSSIRNDHMIGRCQPSQSLDAHGI